MKDDTELRMYEVAPLRPDDTLKASQLIKTHEAALRSILEKLGFSGIRRPSAGLFRSVWAGAPVPGAPQLRARRAGRPACIYIADAVDSLLSLDFMPDEAYAYADAHLQEEDVYYGCLVTAKGKGGAPARLQFLGIVLLRREGRWRAEELMVHQFLPYDKRDQADMLSPLFGGAAFFKLELYSPFLRENGTRLRAYINGLCAPGETIGVEESAYGFLPSPTLAIAGRQEAGAPFSLRHVLFMNDKDPVSELELTARPEEDEPSLLRLMDETGRHFCVESLEGVLLRPKLRSGQRFLWTLNMVAGRCEYNTKEFSVTQGPLFEIEKQRYEQEHGEPPPPDYSLQFSTAEMRHLESGEDSAHAVAMGVIESISQESVGFADVLCMRIHCLPDNDGVHLNVYAAAHVLGGYSPQVGDNIRCSGYLYGAPDTLVEGASWMDSADVGRKQDEREQMNQAMSVYGGFCERSIAIAAVMSALVHEGWAVEEHFWPYAPVFRAHNQRGDSALFAVESVVNGHGPAEAMTAADFDEFMHEPSTEQGRYVMRVALDYHETAQRYALQLLEDGGFGEELSLPSFVGRAYAPTILSLDGDEATEKRQYPEILDEAAMAARFARCVMETDWDELSRWLLEEMSYRSDTVGVSFATKHDYLRYMSRRCLGWKGNGHWSRMSMVAGTVGYGGRRRPCTALIHDSRITALTLFENGDGLVRSMHNIDPARYTDFAAAEDIVAPSAARMAPDSPDAGEKTEEAPCRAALEKAEQMLEDFETTCRHLDAQMEQHGGMATPARGGFRWVKHQFGASGFAGIIFGYQGNEYAVLPARTEPGSAADRLRFGLPREQRDNLLEAAREHDLIPCLFLLNPAGHPLTAGWNLRHLETLAPLSPMEQAARPEALLSSWDLHFHALKLALQEIETRGCRLLSVQEDRACDPQIWFENEQGESCWVLVRADAGEAEPIYFDSLLPVIGAQMAVCRGYMLRCSFRAEDMGPPVRERGFFIRNKGLREITEEDWERGWV